MQNTTPETPCTTEYHDTLKTPATWATLLLVDRWIFDDVALEMRNCPRCHSTLAREVP
jgi:hypothetical protein